MNLTNAQVGIFEDDERTWPATVRLHGFVYNALANDTVDVRARLRWLTRGTGHRHGGGRERAIRIQDPALTAVLIGYGGGKIIDGGRAT
ncbi:hypothetical protein NE236_14970 [Actinoallomurus purpureus]|uniref:hypothetical protein n=1 Tax=Actinoallomurus purpureus TaxID=478114 RepID=UPI002093E63E|nr:hypothetical protein [Actinoallomurus purpureus]MCO6006291.1 hypothetical protein [Actinoallomurus purpureus]